MANKTMKTLTIGEVTYEIVDESARVDIESLKQIDQIVQDNIGALMQETEGHANDIEALKQATVSPDTTLTQSGAAADAKVTGDAIDQLAGSVATINENISTLEEDVAELKTLTPEDIGAMPDTYVAPVTSVNGETGDVVIYQVERANYLTTQPYSFEDMENVKKNIILEQDEDVSGCMLSYSVGYKQNGVNKAYKYDNGLCIESDHLARHSKDSETNTVTKYKIYDEGNLSVRTYVLDLENMPDEEWTSITAIDGSHYYTKSIVVPDMKSETIGYADIDLSDATANTISDLLEAWSMIDRIVLNDGNVEFICYSSYPKINLKIRLNTTLCSIGM